jgi:hypothetical protein
MGGEREGGLLFSFVVGPFTYLQTVEHVVVLILCSMHGRLSKTGLMYVSCQWLVRFAFPMNTDNNILPTMYIDAHQGKDPGMHICSQLTLDDQCGPL